MMSLSRQRNHFSLEEWYKMLTEEQVCRTGICGWLDIFFSQVLVDEDDKPLLNEIDEPIHGLAAKYYFINLWWNFDFDWFYFTDYLLVYCFASHILQCLPKTLYIVVQLLLNQFTGAKVVIYSDPAKKYMKNTAEEALRLEAQSLHWAFQCAWSDSLILLGGNISILLLCGLLLL